MEQPRRTRLRGTSNSRNILIAACAASAGLHAGLVPEHLREEPRLGVAFALTTIFLLALTAALVTGVRPRPTSALASAGLAALIVGYVLSRTAGLPLLEEHGEPFDALGLLTQGIQGAGLLAALNLCQQTDATVSTVRKEVSCT
jgi:peptidoglycan/LPS O-acetylase OafA/YrhL